MKFLINLCKFEYYILFYRLINSNGPNTVELILLIVIALGIICLMASSKNIEYVEIINEH